MKHTLTTINFIKVFLLSMSILFMGLMSANSQITYDNFLLKPNIHEGGLLQVGDPDQSFSTENQFIRRNQVVSLEYTMSSKSDVQNYTAWSYAVILKIMNGADTNQYFLDTLSINRNDSTPVYKFAQYYDLPWYALSIRILNVCGKTGVDSNCVVDPHTYPLIPEDIELSAAIIKTEIKSFPSMGKINSITPYETDVEANCEDLYNAKLQDLEDRYSTLYKQRLEAHFTNVDVAQFTAIEEAIEARFLRISKIIQDTLIEADMAYLFLCDSIVLDSLAMRELFEITSYQINEKFVNDYLSWAPTNSYSNSATTSRSATLKAMEEEALLGFFRDAMGKRINSVSLSVLANQTPSTVDCYTNFYVDTTNHWLKFCDNYVELFSGVQESVLDSMGISDSLFRDYQYVQLTINRDLHRQKSAEINSLNSALYNLCGYGGINQGDCKQYYSDLIKTYEDSLRDYRDSLALAAAQSISLNGSIINYSSGSSLALQSLISQYITKLDSLDFGFINCETDSTQRNLIRAITTQINANNFTQIPSTFLKARAAEIENYYRTNNSWPDSAQWERITDLLIQKYKYEGKYLTYLKFSGIHSRMWSLDSCTNMNYYGLSDPTNYLYEEVLDQIDTRVNLANIYNGIPAYKYEIAYAKFNYDFNSSPFNSFCYSKIDSLRNLSSTKCGSDAEPQQSVYSCLAEYDDYSRELNQIKNEIINSLDSLTTDFKGISRSGGWNDSNGDIVTMFNDYLIPQYLYRFDTTVYAYLSNCLDSNQLAYFAANYFTSNPEAEKEYYNLFFTTPFNNIIDFENIPYDPMDYIADSLHTLQQKLGETYINYFGRRLESKAGYYFNLLNITEAQNICLDSVAASSLGPVEMMVNNDFFIDLENHINAGAVGITTDTLAFKESVLYYTFVKNFIDNAYKKQYYLIEEGREQCIAGSYKESSEIPKPDQYQINPQVSREAEIAACKSSIQSRIDYIQNVRFAELHNIPKIAFGNLNIGLENYDINKMAMKRLDAVDSLWLSCNTDSSLLSIVYDVSDSDAGAGTLYLFPPAYALDKSKLYENGKPTYDYINTFAVDDSLFFMQLAFKRVDWIFDRAAENPFSYGAIDSCVYNRPDSAASRSYSQAISLYQNDVNELIEYFKTQFDSTIIDADSLALKLRWTMAESNRQLHLLLVEYISLEQQYHACENIESQEITWIPENDVTENEPKKLVVSQGLLQQTDELISLQSNNVMDLTTATVSVVTENGGCGNRKFLQWAPIDGALEYDLEWTYIDNSIYTNFAQANTLSNIKYLAFNMSEPVRVTVKDNKFPFPGEYPNGKLYFRVRGVARIVDNVNHDYSQPQYFPWAYNWSGYAVSSAAVNFNGANPFNATFENNLNWQWECSYAEEGKFKKVIAYYDGINRSHQVVTHLSTDDLSVIGETLYDHEGRAAVQVLPYPEKCQELSYRDHTREDMTGQTFDKIDFEIDNPAEVNQMKTSVGASQYYSALNPFLASENPLMHSGAIPDAEGYPYTRTTFMPDNTGRPISSGGVGAMHKVEGAHATRYFFANASESELRRLFGKNVGNAAHYKKNAVMDANGQLSIAYVDQEGRTIATALAGLSPDNVLPLASNSDEQFVQNLDQNNTYDPLLHQWSVNYSQLNEVPNNTYKFNYSYGLDHLLASGTLPCMVCEFDLEIYVTDPKGNRLELVSLYEDGVQVPGSTYTFTKHIDQNSYNLNNACDDINADKEISFSVMFPNIETYTIHKILTWDKDAALDALWTYTSNNSTNQLNSLILQSTSDIDYNECDMFPGVGFDALPPGTLEENTYNQVLSAECESYLTQMINQIDPYNGPIPASPPMPNAGIYENNVSYWNDITELIAEGINDPTNPDYISPDAVLQYAGATPASTVLNIQSNSLDWTPELKRELAKGHPEYCWYKKCMQYAQGVPFDADMASKTNLQTGWPYRNPQQADPQYTLYLSELFNPSNPGNNNLPVPDFIQDDEIIYQMDDDGPNGESIWRLGELVFDNYVPDPAATPNVTNNQAAWQTYRGGYLQGKNNAFYVETSSCELQDANLSTTIIIPPDLPSTEEEMENLNNANANDYYTPGGPICTGACQGNADAWIAQMFINCGEPMPSSGGNLGISVNMSIEEIRQHLVNYCMSQCGPSNPAGIITEEMYAIAMAITDVNDPRYELKLAMDLYNSQFANSSPCPVMDSAVAALTYSTTQYTEICNPTEVSLSNYTLLKLIGKINAAILNTNSTGDFLTVPSFGTSGGSSISISHQLMTGTNVTNCINLQPSPCSVAGASAMVVPSCSTCGIEFYSKRSDETVYQPILPTRIQKIKNPDFANMVIAPNGDATLYVTFETRNVASDGTLSASLEERDGKLIFNIHGCCKGETCMIAPNGWNVTITEQALEDSCEAALYSEAIESAQTQYEAWLDQQINSLWQSADCNISESFVCSYTKREHHYTLYYYDQAANLVQTVPPQGVKPLTTSAFNSNGIWNGSSNPPHNMESRYKFNSLGVAIESETPDGGLTIYKPDLKGRPDESINAEQRRRAIEAYTTPGSPDYNKYVRISSRTHYDYLGRIDSVYEQKLVSPQPSYNLALYYPLPGQPNVTTTPSQITVTLYDNGISTPQNGGWIPKNTIARVAGIRFYESKNAPFKHGTYYSYDIHGNVKSMITDVPALSDYNQRYHRTDYYYDLISGKVNEVHYQHKQLDRMYYRYTYDADNRLVTAESSRDYVGWERDAKYFYYAHGPLKRVETGHRKIQGTDYFYTIHGWLKGVNSGALNETYDLGKDGWEQNSQNPNALIARDAFGFTLDYYTGDYKPVATGLEHVPEMAGDFETAVLQNGLFNGNIVRMQTALRKIDETRMDVLGNAYKYDQLNRIRKNNSFISTDLHTGNSWSGVSETGAYRGEYTYDANGNIITLKRNNAAGTLTDDFNNYNYTSKPTPSATAGYNYVGPQNRLDYIHDNVGSLGMANQSAANYGYDEIGNLVKDESEEIAEIKWTVYGKVKSVKRESSSTKPDLDFQYNASGQRYLKVVKPKNANGTLKGVGDWKFTFYQHDAQGNVLAVYDIKDNDDDCGYEMYLAQHVLYGSARLGVNNYGNDVKLGTSRQNFSGYVHANYWICAEELDDPKDEIPPVTPPSTTTNTGMITLSPGGKYEHIIPIDIGKGPWTKPISVNNYAHVGNQPSKDPVIIIPGRKQYEFSNHLGNVLVTVSDKPIGVDLGNDALVDYYMPDVLTVSDYEPFGAPLENRTESENLSYRFGFNGVEKNNALHGEGNIYDFAFRLYNSRIGRFLSIDPLNEVYPWYSPYQYAGNNPITFADVEGLEQKAKSIHRPFATLTNVDARFMDAVVDMSGASAHSYNSLGWPRNHNYYWEKFQNTPLGKMALSQENRIEIKAGGAPRVDEQWNNAMKKYNLDGNIGEGLEHHHYQKGPNAYGVPMSKHRGSEYNKANHNNNQRGGKVSQTKGRFLGALGALLAFGDIISALNGNPESMVFMFGRTPQIDQIMKDPESSLGTYLVPVSIGKTYHPNGKLSSVQMTNKLYRDYEWDEQQEKYVGSGYIGTENRTFYYNQEGKLIGEGI